MNRESMKIGVVGCGAVGSFYGLMLKQAGEDVHFHLRSNYEDVKKQTKLLERIAKALEKLNTTKDDLKVGLEEVPKSWNRGDEDDDN
mgnify:CR=1 FL=1